MIYDELNPGDCFKCNGGLYLRVSDGAICFNTGTMVSFALTRPVQIAELTLKATPIEKLHTERLEDYCEWATTATTHMQPGDLMEWGDTVLLKSATGAAYDVKNGAPIHRYLSGRKMSYEVV